MKKPNACKSDPSQYRSISIITLLEKLLAKILAARLSDWLDSTDRLSNFQFGFRKNRSTMDAIFLLKSLLGIQKSRRRQSHLAFIDLEKAFDKVNRQTLLDILADMNTPIEFIKWILIPLSESNLDLAIFKFTLTL